MTKIRFTAVTNLAALETRWRDLESRSLCSFFQSWSWVGCLAEERYPDPLLVEATEHGVTVALGLFNRVRRRFGPDMLFLHENGSPARDCPYIEQNGILSEAGRELELTALCLRPLLAAYDLTLSGIDAAAATLLRRKAGITCILRNQPSPTVDLAGLRRAGESYLAGRSANTRRQLRQSDRFFTRDGELRLRIADTAETAHMLLDEMAVLHQAAWTGRGKPGAFANPFFARFHHALLDRAVERGEIALTRVSAGETTIGILYNILWRQQVLSYQSGFAYRAENHARPGLTCHHAAINDFMRKGFASYDFLAGEDRYKRSLSDTSSRQIWLQAGHARSPRLLIRATLQRFRSGARRNDRPAR